MQTLNSDPTFVRVQKGVYAIRALMGDAPYEAIGRAHKKQEHAKDKPDGPAQDGSQAVGASNQEEVESLTAVPF